MFYRIKLRTLVGFWVVLFAIGCAQRFPVSGPEASLPGPRISIPKKLPEEMAPLSEVQVLTRAGLAVLLMMELPITNLHARTRMPMVVDAADHWARNEILNAVRFGLMPVFTNHQFQPDASVTRGELAQVFEKILRVQQVSARERSIAAGLPADLPDNHLFYPAVRRVLETGLMELDSAGRFAVTQKVTGPEALAGIQKIRRLIPFKQSGSLAH